MIRVTVMPFIEIGNMRRVSFIRGWGGGKMSLVLKMMHLWYQLDTQVQMFNRYFDKQV